MTLLTTVALALALGAAQTPPAAPDSSLQPATLSSQAADSASVIAAPAEAPVRVNSGLPQRAPVARTMAAYWPVFAGFTLVWAGIIVYALSFGKRSAKLAEELERLEAEGRPGAI